MRWYVVGVAYPSALQARRAWGRAERKLDLSQGDQGIGLYRLAPDPAVPGPSSLVSGKPHDAHAVVAITLDEPTARKAERLLRDGDAFEPTPGFADAMIARRARVVLAHAGETGRLVIRRPEGRGAKLDREGTMHEQVGGDE
jgi:hypothetical protein